MAPRTLSAELAAASDALTSHLANAEAALASLGLGVPASVPCGDGAYVLTFDKHGKTWRLTVTGERVGQPWPVVNAPRAARVAAAVALSALLRAMHDAQPAVLAEVQLAAGQAEAFVDALRSRRAGA